MHARRLWLLVLFSLLGACSAPPPPDPAATEAAIQQAVAATATAVAALRAPAPAPAIPPTAAALEPTAPPLVRPTTGPLPTQVGTVAPAGTGAARKPIPLTPEEAAYVRGVREVISEYNRSFDRFGELLDQPNVEDPSWRLALSAELTFWAASGNVARDVQPPAAFREVHRQVIAGLDLYQQAARQITQGLETGDRAQLTEGLETVRRARLAFAADEEELARIAREREL